jgi:hypothetical protein
VADRALPGYRFDATQALRQVLAVLWGMIDVNPAKRGVDNPSPRRREQRPFESWAELDAVRRESRAPLPADGDLRGRDRTSSSRVARAREATTKTRDMRVFL